MTDRERTMAAAVLGAVIGGGVGYLFLTQRGWGLRRRVGPALEALARELSECRGALTGAFSVAGQGWRILRDAMNDPRGTMVDPHDAMDDPREAQTSQVSH